MTFSEITKIFKSNLDGYSNIFTLNGYQLPKDKDVYHKYMPVSTLRDYYNNNHITFVSPLLWTDPFETRYFKIKGYNAPNIFCMCLTDKQSQNEDAMWIRYAKPREEMVKVNIMIKPLLDYLEKSNITTYIGPAIYCSQKDIKKITKNNKLFFPPGNLQIENYLTLMSLKRGAFAYENEVRLFVVPESPSGLSFSVSVSRLADIINKITVSPYPVTCNCFPNPDSMSYLDKRKERTSFEFSGINTEASRLFKECPNCVLLP